MENLPTKVIFKEKSVFFSEGTLETFIFNF